MRRSGRGPGRAVERLLDGRSHTRRIENSSIPQPGGDWIARSEDERTAFDRIRADQRRNVARSGVDAKDGRPAAARRRCCCPAENLESDAVELKGNGLCDRGRPQRKDDREAREPVFHGRTENYGSAIVRRLIGPTAGPNPPPPAAVRISALPASTCARWRTLFSAAILS